MFCNNYKKKTSGINELDIVSQFVIHLHNNQFTFHMYNCIAASHTWVYVSSSR